MTTLVSEPIAERAARQARARAIAAAVLDAPPDVRCFMGVDRPGLVGSQRRRRTARLRVAAARDARPRPGRRRLIALVLLGQVALLAGLLVFPTFRVATLEVSGAHLLSADRVARIAGAQRGQNIFTVDGDALRRRLLADPWVATASVETALPATVRITVTERPPELRVRRNGSDLLVATNGATLPVSAAVASAIHALPQLDDQRPALAGEAPPLDSSLLGVLASTAASFPSTYGCAVASFRWRADGVLTIVTVPGWTAVLGNLDDPNRIAEIPAQLGALASLKGRLNFTHPAFGYVDLEDPAAPAVGGTPGQSPDAVPTTPPAPVGVAPIDVAPAATPAPTPPAAAGTPAATPVVIPLR